MKNITTNILFWLSKFNQEFASRHEEIVFKLSLMLLVLDGSTGWNSQIGLRILCTLMLVFDKFAGNRLFWAFIAIILLLNNSLQWYNICLLYTSPSPRDQRGSRMPSSA